jgi:hypothetical protein
MLTSAHFAVSPASHHPPLHRVCMQTRPRHLVHPHAFINGLNRIFQGNDVAFSAKNTQTIGSITDVSPMGVGMNSISHPLYLILFKSQQLSHHRLEPRLDVCL